ncbi:type IV secretory system conjugative DNA transfer family protein, partial [Snodgrassella sp. CFCC 13594]|uniref:type IV secretory system conjugative DNA transfer family protein n=1 Tax=Snodgrassella sp. CFCC 13594 TaxID=1775559 RepID=UPI0009ECEC4F
HRDALPEAMHFPLMVSAVVSGILAIAPFVLVMAATFAPEKRELHGSARFANKVEVLKTGLLQKEFNKTDYPDLLIGKFGKDYLRWASNTFLYLAAPTRSGKGVGIVIPNCLHYRGSMVVYDPKLENFLITGGFRQDKLKQKVFLFNPAGQMPEHAINPNAPVVSHRWNPMTYIRRDPRYMYKDIMKMADILIPKPSKDTGSATFFAESAQKLFTGLVLYMLETEQERDLDDSKQKSTLANLFRMTAPPNGMTLTEWIKEEIELRDQQPHTQLSSNCKTLLYGFANGNAKTGADILATLTAPLGVFLDPVVEAATSGDDFMLTDVRRQRMTIYIGIIPTDTGPFSRLTNLFFSQLVSLNVQQGLPENNPAIKYQCTLLMDEFTALGVIPAIQHGVSYIAGYGLRLLIIIQSPSQVTDLYGRDATRTFFTNFDCHVVFTPADDADAEEYSKMIGYETFKAKSLSRSSGRGGSRSQNQSDQRRAVMLPQELKLMPSSECIISMAKNRPIKAQKIIYWQDPAFIERANLPCPIVPALQVNAAKRLIGATAVVQYMPDEVMATADARDVTNAADVFNTLLKNLITPDCPPEYIEKMSQCVQESLGINAMPIFKAVLSNT